MAKKFETAVKGSDEAKAYVSGEPSDRQAAYSTVRPSWAFFSRHRNLTVTIYEEVTDEKTGRPKMRAISKDFMGGTLTETREDRAKALREADGFGGSKDQNFANARHGEPIFFEGGFPDWFIDQEDDRTAYLTPTAGNNESDFLIEPRNQRQRFNGARAMSN